jgi:rhomboid family GlyGly-CTERM serine protease
MSTHFSDKPLPLPTSGISWKQIETLLWLILLLVCNYSLLQGHVSESFIFDPKRVANGEWHRIFLAPFTHVSWYHLGLDGAAFMLLWNGLQEKTFWGRYVYLFGCWVGSMVLPLTFSTNVYTIGLCGLSGISHGLFVVIALEIIYHQSSGIARMLSKGFMAGLLAKTGGEILWGEKVMSVLHFGDIGTPIVTSHLGGIIGGSLAFGLMYKLRANRFQTSF